VAGIAALVLSANRTLKWTAVRNILRSSADKIDKKDGRYEDGYSIRHGFGRVNAEAAVESALRRKGARRPRAGKKR
jgi:subtilisin family serine protease